jgi:hypothetical protein
MKTKQLLISMFIGSASLMLSQVTTFSVRVSSALDDHEERISGSVSQTGTLGNMDAGSSDLELGNEKAAADPQLVGVRFSSVAIPANATIVNAYIQFTVDDIAKNTDPCVLSVQAEDNINAATFSDSPFSLSTRTLLPASVSWTVSGATWGTVGSAGPDQRTSDIKSLVQTLVNKAGWASGKPMAFFIKGNGTREVEAYDGDAPNAPLLVVQYSLTATGIAEQLNSSNAVTVYPNPFNGSFNINVEVYSASDLNIYVYDLTGKIVEEKTSVRAEMGTFKYTLGSKLSSGLYFVKVQANNKQEVVKVIAE